MAIRLLASERSEEFASPLTLVQTMAYLTYVLRAHSGWLKDIHLVTAPDIESASMLGLPAFKRAEHDAVCRHYSQ